MFWFIFVHVISFCYDLSIGVLITFIHACQLLLRYGSRWPMFSSFCCAPIHISSCLSAFVMWSASCLPTYVNSCCDPYRCWIPVLTSCWLIDILVSYFWHNHLCVMMTRIFLLLDLYIQMYQFRHDFINIVVWILSLLSIISDSYIHLWRFDFLF